MKPREGKRIGKFLVSCRCDQLRPSCAAIFRCARFVLVELIKECIETTRHRPRHHSRSQVETCAPARSRKKIGRGGYPSRSV